MAVQTFVGSFAKATGTGNQDVSLSGHSGIPADLTALPTGSWAIVFWASRSNSSSGTWVSTALPAMGFAANGGGSISQHAVSFASQDGVIPNSGRRISNTCITLNAVGDGTVTDEATFSGFPSASTMRLNWTSQAVGWGAVNINYMLITGLTNAKVVATGMGGSTGTQTVSGVGFTPDLALHVTCFVTTATGGSTHGLFSFGAINDAGEQWAQSLWTNDNVDPSKTSRYQRSDRALLAVRSDVTEETSDYVAAYSAMNSDGYTMNATTNNIGASWTLVSLCMSGVDSKLGSFNKVGTNSTQTVSTSHSFTPAGALLTSVAASASTSPAAQALWTLGASDGTNSRSVSIYDQDNSASTSIAKSLWRSAAVLDVGTSAASAGVATYSNADTDSFDLTWTSNGGGTEQILYMLLSPGNVTPTITITSPANAATTTDDTPDFVFSVTDPDASQTLTVTVEIYSDSGLTSLLQTRTNTTSAPASSASVTVTALAITRGTTVYWRAKVSDGTATSSWTATRSLTVNYDTPTITVDAMTIVSTGGPNLTIGWTYSQAQGLTQASRRVRVQNAAGSTTYYDSGVVASATDEVTIDAVAAGIPTDTSADALKAVVDVVATTSGGTAQDDELFAIQWGVVSCTVTSPLDGAVVTDSTPTIEWTFGSTRSKTQAHYRVRFLLNGTSTVHSDSGKTAGTAASYTPVTPLVDNNVYDVEVTLWNSEGVTN